MSVETEPWLAARIGQVEEYANGALVRRVPGATLEMELAEPRSEEAVAPVDLVVPRPRRASVFLRHGGGHGRFSELTITHPARA